MITLSDLPARSIRVTPPMPYKYQPHYLLSHYGITEPWQQQIIVVEEGITEPTVLRSPGARTTKRNNVMAVLVPSIDSVDATLAAAVTGVHATFFELREWRGEARAKGSMNLPADTPSRIIRAG